MVEFLTPPPPPPPPPWGPSVATMEPPAAESQAAIGARMLLARQARERLDAQQSPWMGFEAEVAAEAYGWD